jgi:hypothetical protein
MVLNAHTDPMTEEQRKESSASATPLTFPTSPVNC